MRGEIGGEKTQGVLSLDRFLTTKQASFAVGLNSSRVCQLLRSGKLKGEKMGRDWLISRREIERFIEERKKR